MSTRATIAVRRPSGDYLAVYLHYDGYPEHAGRLLAANYQTGEEAETLIADGDIRSLDAELGEPDRFSNGPATSVLPTHDSLVDFAQNCGASYCTFSTMTDVSVLPTDACHNPGNVRS